MTTVVKMKRDLFGMEIKQNNQNSFFSATDLFRAGNKWRALQGMDYVHIEDWKKSKANQDFLKALEAKENRKVYIAGSGRGRDTWVHPFIFIDMALWISPQLKIETYRWLYDHLIEFRNQSGDSYKKMTGALYLTETNKKEFTKNIVKLANRIQLECGVDDWQTATEEQLKLRDRIHDNIALLSDILKDRETLYNVAIKKAKEYKK